MDPAHSGREIEVVDYSETWPVVFAELGGKLRRALGTVDHIGSTLVPGLAAKPVIDIQISVAALEPVGPFCEPLGRLKYVYRPDKH